MMSPRWGVRYSHPPESSPRSFWESVSLQQSRGPNERKIKARGCQNSEGNAGKSDRAQPSAPEQVCAGRAARNRSTQLTAGQVEECFRTQVGEAQRAHRIVPTSILRSPTYLRMMGRQTSSTERKAAALSGTLWNFAYFALAHRILADCEVCMRLRQLLSTSCRS